MKQIPLLFLLLTLAGCAPSFYPMGPAIQPPTVTNNHLIAADGARLPVQKWQPPDGMETRAVIIGVHGFNDYANSFALPGAYWAKHSIMTIAYDQRGFGRAPHRGRWTDTATMTADLRAAIAAVRKRYPGLPVWLVGVSMGGAVTMAALAQGEIPGVEGAVLVAPAVWGRAHMNVISRASLWLVSRTMPGLMLSAQGLRIQPSDNIAMLRKLARDPLIIKETRAATVRGLVDLMDAAYDASSRLGHTRTLMVYGLKDEIVPKPATLAAMQALKRSSGKARFAIYKGGYHMLLRGLKAERLWRDIAHWIENPGAPLPSGAEKKAAEILAKKTATAP